MNSTKLQILTLWQERMQSIEAPMDTLCELTMASPESPLMQSIYGLMGLCTRQAAELVGCSDEWLQAWWLDHNFGERPMKAGLAGEEPRNIATLEDLLALICDDEAAA